MKIKIRKQSRTEELLLDRLVLTGGVDTDEWKDTRRMLPFTKKKQPNSLSCQSETLIHKAVITIQQSTDGKEKKLLESGFL